MCSNPDCQRLLAGPDLEVPDCYMRFKANSAHCCKQGRFCAVRRVRDTRSAGSRREWATTVRTLPRGESRHLASADAEGSSRGDVERRGRTVLPTRRGRRRRDRAPPPGETPRVLCRTWVVWSFYRPSLNVDSFYLLLHASARDPTFREPLSCTRKGQGVRLDCSMGPTDFHCDSQRDRPWSRHRAAFTINWANRPPVHRNASRRHPYFSPNTTRPERNRSEVFSNFSCHQRIRARTALIPSSYEST